MRGPSPGATLVLALVVACAAARAQPAPDVPQDVVAASASPASDTAVLSEVEPRYRLSAAIRPLLFWLGASNVGGARIVWRQDGEARKGYELLLGSDPARAPRRINRWGWVREDADASGATMYGVMNRSVDESLDQAKAGLGRAKQGYFFKMISARVENGSARAESTKVFAPQDYTFRQLAELQRFAEGVKPTPGVSAGGVPAGTHPGLLFALADLVRAGIEASRSPGGGGPVPVVQFTFDARVYDLAITSWRRVERAQYGGRTFEKLIRLEFEARNRQKRTTEHFELACGTEGPLAGIPVFVRYQPKWWFKVEGVLDENELL